MSDVRLATAGEDVKVWELPNYSLLYQFNSQDGEEIDTLSDLSWSSDGNCIASTTKSANKVVCTYMNSSSLVTTDVAAIEKPCNVAFPCMTPRYLGIGSQKGEVCIWDLKNQVIKKKFKLPDGSVSAMTFNFSGNTVVAGSQSGDISLLSVTTGQIFASLHIPKSQRVTCLRYNLVKRAILGSSSEAGILNLWDTNKRQLLHSYTSSHTAPCTGLAFSPLNEILMVSTGLDKRLVCYDVQTKMLVKKIDCDSPLTAVEFLSNGINLVVGTSRGKVLVYDLRGSNIPVTVFTAHKTSVWHVRLQPQVKQGQMSVDTKKNTVRPSVRSIGAELNHNVKKEEYEEAVNFAARDDCRRPRSDSYLSFHDKNSKLLSSEVFSPLRDSIPATSDLHHASGVQDQTQSEDVRMSTEGLFSPLRENRTNMGSHQQPVEATPDFEEVVAAAIIQHTEEINTENAISCTKLKRNKVEAEACSFTDTEKLDGVVSVAVMDHKILPCEWTKPEQGKCSVSEDHCTTEETLTRKPELQSISSKENEQLLQNKDSLATQTNKHILNQVVESIPQKFSHLSSELITDMHSSLKDNKKIEETVNAMKKNDVIDSDKQSLSLVTQQTSLPASRLYVAGAEQVAPTTGGGAFQVEFIRRMVEGAMEEFCDEIRTQLLRLNYDIIQLFQRQQTELETLLKTYSINEEMMIENQRLRKENQELRKLY